MIIANRNIYKPAYVISMGRRPGWKTVIRLWLQIVGMAGRKLPLRLGSNLCSRMIKVFDLIVA
jgi:hypothetical protein